MSTTAAEQDAAAGAPRVGADLCAARRRLGWSLEGVAAALRIRLQFLTALEEGRIADLPGNAYALGFLRTYAAALGLDPTEMTRRFRAEAAEVNRLTRLSFPAPVPSRGVPTGAVVLLGMVLGDRRLYRVVPPVGQRRAAARGGGAGAGAPRTFGRAGRAALHRHTNFTSDSGGVAVAVRPGCAAPPPPPFRGPPAVPAVLDQPAPEPTVPPTQAAAATTAHRRRRPCRSPASC